MRLKNVVTYLLTAIVFTTFYKSLKLSMNFHTTGRMLTESEMCVDLSEEDFGELTKIRTTQWNVLKNPLSTRFIYNRIPKCGSTTVNKIFDQLSAMGRFNIHHSTIYDQLLLSETGKNDVCETIRSGNTPIMYERHMFYFDMVSSSEKALIVAKRRLENEYSIVGINEDLPGFFQLLEWAFPSFFKGVTQIYSENEKALHNASLTKIKIAPSAETVDILRKKMKYDIDLYHFAVRHYYKLKCLMESDRVV